MQQKYINSNQKVLKLKKYPLYLPNISKTFSVNNMKKKDFSVDYRTFNISDTIDIHKYLTKKTRYKIMFGLIKNIFIGLLSVSATESFGESLVSNLQGPIKCIFLNDHPCQARLTLVNINSGETFFIHLLLVLISVVEVVTLLTMRILEFMFQIK